MKGSEVGKSENAKQRKRGRKGREGRLKEVYTVGKEYTCFNK